MNYIPPNVFISYSYDNDLHCLWVRKLATDLLNNGVNAILDVWDAPHGSNLLSFMTNNCETADRVLAVCTEKYGDRSKSTSGGVPYESLVLTGEILANTDTKKIIPLLRRGEKKSAIPVYLRSRKSIDFRDDRHYHDSLTTLIDELLHLTKKPSLKPPPKSPAEVAEARPEKARVRLPEFDDKGRWQPRFTHEEYVPPPEADVAQLTASAAGTSKGVRSGFLVAGDLFNSSKLPDSLLLDATEKLWKHSTKILCRGRCLSSQFLDNMVVGIDGSSHEQVLSDCASLAHELAKGSPPIYVRLAVHFGRFEAGPSKTIVGAAARDCVRMAQLSAPDCLVASEEFVQDWIRLKGDVVLKKFTPSTPEAFKVPGRLGQMKRIRFLRQGDGNGMPPSYRFYQQVEREIYETLEQIEDEFQDHVRQWDKSRTPNRLAPRVCLWAPDSSDYQRLVATPFRYIDPKYDSHGLKRPGKTFYSFADRARPHGPVGLSFTRNEVFVVNNLPSYKQSKRKYIDALSQPRWNIPEPTIRDFGRHARTFLAVPFGFGEPVQYPFGVICLDSPDPLAKVKENLLIDMGTDWMTYYGKTLAALWRLRTQLPTN